MDILVVDHDKKNLEQLVKAIKDFEPSAFVTVADNLDDALKIVNDRDFDAAFLEPDNKDKITAKDLALRMKERNRNTHILFMSKTKASMSDAFSVHADAYIMKPVKPDVVSREMDYLINFYPAPLRPVKIVVKTFGGFNAYYQGKKLMFKRNKSKELLAILVDNRGVGLTTREACSMLFGGREYDEILLGYFHVVLTSLKSTLDQFGITNLIRKSVNYISINTDLIDCDMYRFLKGESNALMDYHGDYMKGYSWSERSRQHVRGNQEDDREEKVYVRPYRRKNKIS